MTSNELEVLHDEGMIDYRFRNGSSLICIVLKLRKHTKKIRAYMACVNGFSELTDIQHTMLNGMKLSQAEALGFFPEPVDNIVKHYFID